MEPTKEYKITVSRITTSLKTGRTEFKEVGKEEDGSAKYDYVAAPDKVETDTVTVLKVRAYKINLSKIFEAVSND